MFSIKRSLFQLLCALQTLLCWQALPLLAIAVSHIIYVYHICVHIPSSTSTCQLTQAQQLQQQLHQQSPAISYRSALQLGEALTQKLIQLDTVQVTGMNQIIRVYVQCRRSDLDATFLPYHNDLDLRIIGDVHDLADIWCLLQVTQDSFAKLKSTESMRCVIRWRSSNLRPGLAEIQG